MKKFFWFVAITAGVSVYLYNTLTQDKILELARSHHDPDLSPKVEYWMGQFHYTTNDYRKAETDFSQLLTDDPTSYYAPVARVRLADTYFQMAERDKALEQYQKYLDDNPNGELAAIAQKNVEILRNH